MSDEAQPSGDGDAQPTVEQPAVASDGVADVSPPSLNGTWSPTVPQSDRPELVVGAAFAGGLVFALFLKRLAR